MQIITNASQKELKKHGSFQFPLLISPERLSGYETGSFLWHWHPEIELTLIEEGEILYRVGHETFHLVKGQALFCNANALHAGNMVKNRDCRYISVTFDPKLIYGYENSLIHEKYVIPLLKNPELSAVLFDGSQSWHREVIEYIRTLISLQPSLEPALEMELLITLQTFWKLLFIHTPPVSSLPGRSRVNDERIRTILAYIGANYASKITLKDIADEVHLCPSECSRLFGQYMKQPLFEFLLAYRIDKSLSFLADPSCTITEAAALCGFHDSNYFSKVFCRMKGVSPSAYRKAFLLR